MKKMILLLVAIIATTQLLKAQGIPPAQEFFPASSYYGNGTYNFRTDVKMPLEDIVGKYSNAFFGCELVNLSESDIDSSDFHHSRYMQYYGGYPIEATQINIISKKDVVLHVNGFWLKGFSVDATQTVSEADALDSALNYLKAPMYNWQDSQLENGIKYKFDEALDTFVFDSTATLYPKGKLLIAHPFGDTAFNDHGTYALCWKFYITPM